MPDTVLLNGDAFALLPNLEANSVDFILIDPNYGTTRNTWDKRTDFNTLWPMLWRVLKPNGCIAVWAQSPYDKLVACSAMKQFRYEWIIEKTNPTGHLNANRMPMKAHENVLVFHKKGKLRIVERSDSTKVLVFYRNLPTYNPQKTHGHERKVSSAASKQNCVKSTNYNDHGLTSYDSTDRFPRDVLCFPWDKQKSALHPTQKPVVACEYMIKTYTNPNDTVLDCFMGSGTTGVAARNLGRKFIGIEMEPNYFEIAKARIINRDTEKGGG